MLSFHQPVVIDLTLGTVELVGKEDEPMPIVEDVELEYHREPDPIDLDGNTNHSSAHRKRPRRHRSPGAPHKIQRSLPS